MRVLLLLPLTLALPAFAAPAWVDGKDPRYDRAQHLVGVGSGSSRQSADNDARAELSRLFEAKVTAVAKDFQAAATAVEKSGKGVSVEVQAVSQYTEVTTQKTLEAVEIRERAQDGGTHYALAVLERAKCVQMLEEVIAELDQRIQGHLRRAEGGDAVAGFKAYGAALNLMDEREGKNAMLRVCRASGQGVASPVSLAELSGKFGEAAGSLRLGIDLVGSGAGRVKDCLMELLGNKGYQLEDIQVEDEDEEEEEQEDKPAKGFDLILKGRLKSEKAGEIAGSVMVRTDLVLRLVNPATKKVLKTVTANRKEGRPSVKASAALSAYKICQKEMPKLVEEIDKFFRR